MKKKSIVVSVAQKATTRASGAQMLWVHLTWIPGRQRWNGQPFTIEFNAALHAAIAPPTYQNAVPMQISLLNHWTIKRL